MLAIIEEILIGDDGRFPGSHLPALLYKNAVDIPLLFPATHVKNIFEGNKWYNTWDAGIFTYHHYHSITHEVLGIYFGSARVQLGDDNGPILLLEKGDVLVIPAGVAHKNLDGENDVGVVGAYPDGGDYDIKRGEPGERPHADRNIAAVRLPATDPLAGSKGGLIERWGTPNR